MDMRWKVCIAESIHAWLVLSTPETGNDEREGGREERMRLRNGKTPLLYDGNHGIHGIFLRDGDASLVPRWRSCGIPVYGIVRCVHALYGGVVWYRNPTQRRAT
ncbi:hypothetical protein I7I51_02614 [Histoplasma capsulatum]|uniref:Uncharacterized protein n=1 Tax=Ajellomyces capsulatus TaxID=5037 RepID=A0A8A1MA65_AJECA|nr:hypothetical protein I7I51_02614 [Histoplasma capsulatum]